jgi:hypothetical protein
VEPLVCQECFFSLVLSVSVRISLSLVARESEQEREEERDVMFSKRETVQERETAEYVSRFRVF